MANEVEIINNPTSTPAAVSTGYQRQNTRMVAASVGMDASIVEGGAGQCTALISGPIDVNGVLYTIKAETVLVPVSAGRWYIYLEAGGSVSYLTPTLTDDPGAYDETKFARYTSGGKRILNWLIDYDGTTCRVSPWKTPEYSGNQNYLPDLDSQPETWITASGTWVAPRSKYYTIWMTAKGEGGGSGTSGGASSSTGFIRAFIEAGTVLTAVFSSLYSGYATLVGGDISLSVLNGGGPDIAPTGFDSYIPGAFGGYNFTSPAQGNPVGGKGAASFYGDGGNGGWSSTPNGQYAKAHGAGGGGAYSSSYTVGAGGPGLIRIIG